MYGRQVLHMHITAASGGILRFLPNRLHDSSTSKYRRRRLAFVASATVNGDQNHYAILGLSRSASLADIKKAYRLLARKFHPDVSKDSGASEVFKSIRTAYVVLSDDASRIQYDRALAYRDQVAKHWGGNLSLDAEYDDEVTLYKWADLKWRIEQETYRKQYYESEDDSLSHSESEDMTQEEILSKERGSFMEVLKSAFLSLFLMQTVGCQLSLTFSSLMALADQKLDAGYRVGYLTAWVLGGRGGILLTLCLSFASWFCGKTSSGVVVLVVVATWVGSYLARYVPLPQGALLTLMYMSIKLQVDLK